MSKQGLSHINMERILVLGATGNQGYSVANALLHSSKFRVTALIKDINHPLVKDLQNRGAKIVVGDLEDPSDIRIAMAGCVGVFNVQNSWEIGVDHERKQGKLVALIAKEFDCVHFVHSTLDYTEKETGIPLPHADVKAEIAEYIKEIGLPYTFIYLRPLLQNFLEDLHPSIENDEYIFKAGINPNTKLGFLDVHDIGPIVVQIFENHNVFLYKNIKIAGDFMNMKQFVEIFQKITGKKARYEYVPNVDNIERANMFKVYDKFDLSNGVFLNELKVMNPALHNVESWLKESQQYFF